MRWPFLCLSLAVLAASIAAASADNAGKKCYCRTATGQKLEVGKVTCLKTGKGLQEARCDLVLNNTAWIFTGNQCPIAENGDHGRPAILTSGERNSPHRYAQLPETPIFDSVRLTGMRDY